MAATKLIEWDEGGYPTEASLRRLRKALRTKDIRKAIEAFYAALRENHYSEGILGAVGVWCGPERVEVRGEIIDVWGYHTGGWSGNESIIAALQTSWLFGWLLERCDRGGHFYFRPPEKVLREVGA